MKFQFSNYNPTLNPLADFIMPLIYQRFSFSIGIKSWVLRLTLALLEFIFKLIVSSLSLYKYFNWIIPSSNYNFSIQEKLLSNLALLFYSNLYKWQKLNLVDTYKLWLKLWSIWINIQWNKILFNFALPLKLI